MSVTTTAPHLERDTPLLRTRRGNFWIPGDVVDAGPVHVQRGPMHVEWEAPEEVTHPHPLVLVHGGGGQGTDWMSTPDGRPGWARLLVEQGYAVYVVDRVGHGRSPYHPDVIAPGSISSSTSTPARRFWATSPGMSRRPLVGGTAALPPTADWASPSTPPATPASCSPIR